MFPPAKEMNIEALLFVFRENDEEVGPAAAKRMTPDPWAATSMKALLRVGSTAVPVAVDGGTRIDRDPTDQLGSTMTAEARAGRTL
jgi:hypothetical protein